MGQTRGGPSLTISAPADAPSYTEMLGWRPLRWICSSRTEECGETADEPALSLPCHKSPGCQQNVQLFLLTRPCVGWGRIICFTTELASLSTPKPSSVPSHAHGCRPASLQKGRKFWQQGSAFWPLLPGWESGVRTATTLGWRVTCWFPIVSPSGLVLTSGLLGRQPRRPLGTCCFRHAQRGRTVWKDHTPSPTVDRVFKLH